MTKLDLFFFVLYYLNLVATLVAVVTILLEKEQSASMISWLLAIMVFQSFGLILYLLVGINWRKRKLLKIKPETVFNENFNYLLSKQEEFLSILESHSDNIEKERIGLIRMMYNSNGALVTTNNDCTLFHTGTPFFSSLMEDLRQAKKSIHMEFYIWRSDSLGNAIKDILIERVHAGVEVRLIFDGWGSFKAISRKYRKELKKAGVQFKYWLDLSVMKTNLKLNYRNHRKIVVIDGQIGYVGGMNIGQEYISGTNRMKSWRDTHMRITGDAVRNIQGVFLVDWLNSGNEPLPEEAHFPKEPSSEFKTILQVITSGPDSSWDSIAQSYFALIGQAKERVYIQTPYLVPDVSLVRMMETRALSGVEVHLMVTGIPDKRVPYWVGQTFYERLLRSGVRIYQYMGGFLHSKVLVIDDSVASLGTCNLDIRSLEINYEINVQIFNVKLSKELVDHFKKDLKVCREIQLKKLKKRWVLIRLRNNIFRVFSPLL